jgi:hypothetical protein
MELPGVESAFPAGPPHVVPGAPGWPVLPVGLGLATAAPAIPTVSPITAPPAMRDLRSDFIGLLLHRFDNGCCPQTRRPAKHRPSPIGRRQGPTPSPARSDMCGSAATDSDSVSLLLPRDRPCSPERDPTRRSSRARRPRCCARTIRTSRRRRMPLRCNGHTPTRAADCPHDLGHHRERSRAQASRRTEHVKLWIDECLSPTLVGHSHAQGKGSYFEQMAGATGVGSGVCTSGD